MILCVVVRDEALELVNYRTWQSEALSPGYRTLQNLTEPLRTVDSITWAQNMILPLIICVTFTKLPNLSARLFPHPRGSYISTYLMTS